MVNPQPWGLYISPPKDPGFYKHPGSSWPKSKAYFIGGAPKSGGPSSRMTPKSSDRQGLQLDL